MSEMMRLTIYIPPELLWAALVGPRDSTREQFEEIDERVRRKKEMIVLNKNERLISRCPPPPFLYYPTPLHQQERHPDCQRGQGVVLLWSLMPAVEDFSPVSPMVTYTERHTLTLSRVVVPRPLHSMMRSLEAGSW